VVYLLLGDSDPAFQWLEKAFQERDTKLPYLKIQPGVEPYLKDTRFLDFLHRMNISA